MTLSEREKMLRGELYFAADPALVALRQRARRLTRLYNATTEGESARRREILGELFGRMRRAMIEPPFHCDYGSNIYAGDNLYMNFGCMILDCAEVSIGSDLQAGPYVQIYTAHHPLDAAERTAGPELASPVTIGSRVWLGGGVIICPGVTIGDDTTIGAGSVVTRDVPPGVLAVGNPCRVVRAIEPSRR
jgi:maltose O-acetyltransferase